MSDKPPPDKAADAAASGGNSLAAGADRIRESAKWLIVAFAAVGTVLVAGLQLTSLGHLDDDRMLRAIIGLVAATAGVVIAINAAGKVVTSSFVTMKWLTEQASDAPALEEIEGDVGLLGGYSSVDQLKTAYDEAVGDRRDALRKSYDAPDDAAKAKRAETAQAWVKALNQSQVHVLERASFNNLRAAYKRAGRWITVGAVLAAAGIATFAWAANPPAGEEVALVLPQPTEVTVSIDKEDQGTFAETLGANCDLNALDGVVVDAVGESYEVATVATRDCAAKLIDVAPDVGTVTTANSGTTQVVQPSDPGSGDTS